MGVNETLLKYLQDQNRPYSANDIVQNLHKEFGKTAIQKALDFLVAKGKILEKKYGKQKVYAIMRDGKFNKAEFQARQEKLKAKQGEQEIQITRAEAQSKSLDAELRDLKETITSSDAKKQMEKLKSDLIELKTRHERLTNNVQLITDKEKENIVAEETRLVNAWRKRRRMAVDVLDAILENYPKSKKSLYEDIGIETDEDAKVSLPQAR